MNPNRPSGPEVFFWDQSEDSKKVRPKSDKIIQAMVTLSKAELDPPSQHEETQKSALIHTLEKQRSTFAGHLGQLLEKTESLEEQNETLTVRLKEATKLTEKLKKELESQKGELKSQYDRELEARLAKVNDYVSQIDEAYKARTEQIQQLQEVEKAELTRACESQKIAIEKLRKALQKCTVEIELKKNDVTAAQKMIDEYQRINQSLESSIRSRDETLLQMAPRNLSNSESTPESLMISTQEKADIQGAAAVCKELSQELQTLSERHPLADYLQITEMKLREMERELIRVPLGHPDRMDMEKTVQGLLDQRDLLVSLLNDSRKHFAASSERLSKASTQLETILSK